MLYGFEGQLKNNDVNNIFNIPDARICQYIRYYYQKRIVNLTKTKKADLKTIMSPVLVEYYEKSKATMDFAAATTALEEDTVTFTFVVECVMVDDAKRLSARDV